MPGRLCGSAHIADGKLRLNGSDAYLATIRPNLQRMYYKARNIGNQWDTWVYQHGDQYFLFTLAHAGAGGQWYGISLAQSDDGVRWQEVGQILSKAPGVAWLGTGHTWKSPSYAVDGRFLLNFSEWLGDRQTIFFAESRDLLSWRRLGNQYEFVQDERWYERNGRWDCIYAIPRSGGGLLGFWTATPKSGTGGRFGFGQTLDGIKWEALAPPKVSGVGEGEVGAVAQIGRRFYMMFGAGGKMITLVAEQPEGPFRAAEKNQVLFSGQTYFSRFLPTENGVLVNHHSIARDGQVYFAPLKQAVVDAEGVLRLKWWNGNEQLREKRVEVRVASSAQCGVTMLENDFDIHSGVVLEGTLALPSPNKPKPGIYIQCQGNGGTAILVGPGGVTELGDMGADAAVFQAEDRVDRQVEFPVACPFRLLLKHSMIEFYLNDHLIQCYSPPRPPTGRIGLIGAEDRQGAVDLKAWH